VSKAPQAFRTISEVSETLDVPQHVLRFWEGKFPQIKPLKRAGGRRYYRPEDIELLRGVRALLYAEGYTIKGVQKLLRTSGVRYVCDLGRFGVTRAGRALPADLVHPDRGADAEDETIELAMLSPDEEDAASDDDDLVLTEGDGGEADDAAGAPIAAADTLTHRREQLESALTELLTLRDLLRAARPGKADAA
jgi:DNA-binding transcriptional MerR regulator